MERRKRIGYARISDDNPTELKKLRAQLDRLREGGCEIIYSETVRGDSTGTPELQAALMSLDPGDSLVVDKCINLVKGEASHRRLTHEVGKHGAWIWVCS